MGWSCDPSAMSSQHSPACAPQLTPAVQLWFQLGQCLVQPHGGDCSSTTFLSKILRKTINSQVALCSCPLFPATAMEHQLSAGWKSLYETLFQYLAAGSTVFALFFCRAFYFPKVYEQHPKILWAGPILLRTSLSESRKNKGCSKGKGFQLSSGRWALLALVQSRKMPLDKTLIQSKV